MKYNVSVRTNSLSFVRVMFSLQMSKKLIWFKYVVSKLFVFLYCITKFWKQNTKPTVILVNFNKIVLFVTIFLLC